MSEKTFFIIEDHTVTNIGLRQLLEEKTGAKCLDYAFSKDEAEEKLGIVEPTVSHVTLPDIIILDLFLGKDSGLELFKEIHSEYPFLKILVYSMYSKPGILTLVLEEGAHGFVEKSAPESVLITAVKNILNGETFVQQNLVSPLFTYKTMYDGLTKQEQNILRKIFEQKTREQISEELNIVPRTVDNYLCRIFEKTGCHGIEELFAKFVK